MPAASARRSAPLNARRSNLRPALSLSGAKLSITARSRSDSGLSPSARAPTANRSRGSAGLGGGPVGHRLGRRDGALAHQLLGFQDAPFVAHIGRLEQHAGLQDAHGIELLGPVDQDAPDQPYRVGRRAHQLHLRGGVAVPARPHDHVRRRMPAIEAVAHIGEVVGEEVEEGVAVVEIADRRHGEEQRLERQVEPGRGIERVVVRRRHGARPVIGELGDVAEAVEPLALRIGLVDRGLPARAVHLVDREEVDRRPTRQVTQRAESVLRACHRRRRQGCRQGRRKRAGEQHAAVDRHAARSRPWRRSATKAAASRQGASVQKERARPEGEASTKATAPSSRSACRP